MRVNHVLLKRALPIIILSKQEACDLRALWAFLHVQGQPGPLATWWLMTAAACSFLRPPGPSWVLGLRSDSCFIAVFSTVKGWTHTREHRFTLKTVPVLCVSSVTLSCQKCVGSNVIPPFPDEEAEIGRTLRNCPRVIQGGVDGLGSSNLVGWLQWKWQT